MLRVAVDFDGTIVEDKYPNIGKPKLFAFETLKAMQNKGMSIILWTMRTGKLLNEAVEFCAQHGIEFYAVNANHPDEVQTAETPRKLNVDVFIDDRNVGGMLAWGNIWNHLCSDQQQPAAQPRKRLFGLIK